MTEIPLSKSGIEKLDPGDANLFAVAMSKMEGRREPWGPGDNEMMKCEAALRRANQMARLPLWSETDRDLLHRFEADGAQEAFAILVRRHACMVLNVCRRLLPTIQDAEDVCQATFLILARKAAGPWQESVADWLYATARRVARDARRTTKRREKRERRAATGEAVTTNDQLSARELLTAVDEELERLPSIYREPLVLLYLEELARDEIAARLGVPSGTVKIRLERGRKRLHAALTKRGVVLSTGFLILATNSTNRASSSQLVEAIMAAVSGKPSSAVGALAKGVAMNGSAMKVLFGIAATAVLASAIGTILLAAHTESELPPVSLPASGTVAANPPYDGIDDPGDPLPAGAILRIGTTRFRDGGASNQAALSPDGKILATASETGITLFEPATGRRLLWIADADVPNSYGPNHSKFAFSPDGKKLFTLTAPGSPTVAAIGTISTYDAATGKKLLSFKPPPASRKPNKQAVLGYSRVWFPAGNKHLISIREDMTIFLDPDTGKEVGKLPFATEAAQATSEGLRLFAIPEKGKEVVVYSLDGKQLRALEHTDHPGLLGFDQAGTTVAAAAASENKIRVWDLASGKVLIDVAIAEKSSQYSVITALTITPDRKTVLAATQRGSIYQFDIVDGKELPQLRGHTNFVTGLFVAYEGKTLISSSWDHRILRWELPSGKRISEPDGYNSQLHIDRSPDGKIIAAADSSGLVELLDGLTGQRIQILQERGKSAASRVAFGPDGKSLATAHQDGKIRIWETATGRLVREIEIVTAPKQPWMSFEALAVAPDGRTLAISGTAGDGIGTLTYDVATGKQLWADPSRAGSLAFFPGGRSLASAGFGNQLHFRDAASGKKTGVSISDVYNVMKDHNIVMDLAASPDGKLLATAQRDGFVCLHDPVTGSIVKEWQAHGRGSGQKSGRGSTSGVSFGPGGIWLATAGDRTVALWDVATGELLHRFEGHTGRVCSARFALDGRTLLSFSDDLTGYVWDLRPNFVPADTRATAQLWDDLGGEPLNAFRAVWLAAADPKAPVVFGEKIPSPRKIDGKKFEKLIEELASSEFATRESAEKEMSGFGPTVLQLARKAREGTDSPEVRTRLDRVIRGWSEDPFAPVNWQRRRAVVAMELAGTPASRELLKRWAADAPGTLLSNAAAAASNRLEQLDKSNPMGLSVPGRITYGVAIDSHDTLGTPRARQPEKPSAPEKAADLQRGFDLTKIDRTIRKEPAYINKPRYCLLVLGMKAETKIWLVIDGDRLYMDRNGNGDLTEVGKQVVGKRPISPDILEIHTGPFTEADGKTKHSDLVVSQYFARQYGHLVNTVALDDFLGRLGLTTNGEGECSFADSAKDGPIIHMNGPLTMRAFQVSVDENGTGSKLKEISYPKVGLIDYRVESNGKEVPYKLKAGEQITELHVQLGTPGLGKGTFAAIAVEKAFPKHLHPIAELAVPSRADPSKMLKTENLLNKRCCGTHFLGSLDLPEEAGPGNAKITLSFPLILKEDKEVQAIIDRVVPAVIELPMIGPKVGRTSKE
jgi:RNA polymerase sigma factor (sigma-70 family)